ncbi:MAG: CHASE3 domain-containing protein [Limnoraphis robusta]|jgi:CHASE3 domain sensor protein
MKWSLKTMIIGGGRAVSILATVSGLSYWNTLRLVETSQQVSQNHQVISEIQELIYLIEALKTQQERYIVTVDTTYFYSYQEKFKLIQKQLDIIQKMTAENSSQQNRIPLLKSRVDDLIDLI